MERDAIYCRYSSTAQDNGVSIELQLDVCRKLTGDDPLEFIDRAITGRTQIREAFRKMLAAAETGKFTRLIVYKWDRFGRNAETHATIADLEDLGVKVTSATEGDDFLARGVGLLVSEDYSRKLSQRVQDSMKIRFKQNKTFMGGCVPYGYKTAKGPDDLSRFVINPDEAAVVREVFRLYLSESIGAKRIAKRLPELGFVARKGGRWGWTVINRMLRNELYTGLLIYGKRSDKLDRRTGKIKRVYHDQFLTHRDESLRLVTDADFQRVQDRLKKSVYRDYRLPADVRVFSQRCVCGACGNVMYTRHQSTQRKNPLHYLVCGRRDRFGTEQPHGCDNATRPTEGEMTAWVQDGMRRVLEQKDRIIARALELAEKQLDTNDGRRAKIEGELARVTQGIARFSRMLGDGSLDDDQTRGLLSQIGGLEKQRDKINESLRALAGEASFDRRQLIADIRSAFDDVNRSILERANPAVMNQLVGRFVGRIEVMPDGTINRRKELSGPEVSDTTDMLVSRR